MSFTVKHNYENEKKTAKAQPPKRLLYHDKNKANNPRASHMSQVSQMSQMSQIPQENNDIENDESLDQSELDENIHAKIIHVQPKVSYRSIT